MRRTIETNQAEIELLKQINTAISDEKAAKERRKKGGVHSGSIAKRPP